MLRPIPVRDFAVVLCGASVAGCVYIRAPSIDTPDPIKHVVRLAIVETTRPDPFYIGTICCAIQIISAAEIEARDAVSDGSPIDKVV